MNGGDQELLALEARKFFLRDIVLRFFAERQDNKILALALRLKGAEQIGIVPTRHTAVTRNQNIAVAFTLIFPRIDTGVIRIFRGNVTQCLPQRRKVRRTRLGSLLGPPQFRRRDQFHRLRNLHRVLDALNPEFDGLHICCSHRLLLLSLCSARLFSL